MNHMPYSPYVKDRETLDNGFSKGWGFHFPPSEEYVIDCHTHCRVPSGRKEDIIDALDRWFFYTEAYRQQKLIALVQEKDQFPVYQEVSAEDSRIHWMFWPATDEPDLEAVKQAYEMGACGLKLHNHRIMKGEVPFDIWYSPAWQEIFTFLNEKKVPVLWHVTQRVSYSPYHGGGYNPYFSEGHEKGIDVTNQQLLDQFCKIMDKYPDIPVIAAHQLYLGLDRMAELMDKYPQLTFDTTVGFFTRWCDTIYEADREVYYDFFMKYADRLLFGTDTDLKPDAIGPYQVEAFACHLRFIHQLRLPYEELQLVLYKNCERVLGLPASSSARKHNSRP
jgi:predicted TIM-barrel fold metal-dependent hydrolase